MAGPKNPGTVAPDAVWTALSGLYLTPGMEAGMLALKDRYGANVLVVLYLGWLAENGFSPKENITLEEILSPGRWRRRLVLGPIRGLRRSLFREKGTKSTFKSLLLAAELRQERALLEAMIARTAPLQKVAAKQGTSRPLINQYMTSRGIDAPYKGNSNLAEYFNNIFKAEDPNR